MVSQTIVGLVALRMVINSVAACVLVVAIVRALQIAGGLKRSQLQTAIYLMAGVTFFFTLWMFALSYTLALYIGDQDGGLLPLMVNMFAFLGLLFLLVVVAHISKFVRGDIGGMHANELDEDAFIAQLLGSVGEEE